MAQYSPHRETAKLLAKSQNTVQLTTSNLSSLSNKTNSLSSVSRSKKSQPSATAAPPKLSQTA